MNVMPGVGGSEGQAATRYPEPTGGAHAALYNQGWVILE